MRHLLIITFVMCLGSIVVMSQSSDLHVRRAVLDGRGHLSIEMVQYDPSSTLGTSIDASSVSISIDGLSVPVPPFRCSEHSSTTSISSVLTIDISGSMSRGGP
ncbi:MAG: hypothetical protein NTX15_02650, partial [Candidatus Kapabacteria bacterium]|nr:hypothetical protein [Candidatus Kapabacteria bacterium]